MARLERFELPAAWFVARRSIQMSYRRMETEKWSTGRDKNSREVSLSDLQSDAFNRLATCASKQSVPQTEAGLPPREAWSPQLLRLPLSQRGRTFSKTTAVSIACGNALVGMKGVEPLPVG